MPEKLTQDVTVRMDEPLRLALMELADMADVSLSKYIRRVLRTHVLREMALRERLFSHAAGLESNAASLDKSDAETQY